MLHRWLAVVSIPFLFNCSNKDDNADDVANTVAGCQQQFAASKGYEYGSDSSLVGTVSAPTTTGGTANSPQTESVSALAQAIADCQTAAGSGADSTGQNAQTAGAAALLPGPDCDLSKLMTHDAAVCSARALGLAEGLGYTANLSFNYKFQRIVWNVKNTVKDSAGTASGTSMLLDAVDGRIWEQSSW